MTKTSWTEADVSSLLFNPIYGYGIHLDPPEVVVAYVMQLNQELAVRQRETQKELTLDELDQAYMALMDRLVKMGLCRRMPDTDPLISKEDWLRVQQRAINRLAAGEEL